MIRAIVTDIEGTTSDIRFVHDVLFPYARERLAAILEEFGLAQALGSRFGLDGAGSVAV